jgi:hypothetical protein
VDPISDFAEFGSPDRQELHAQAHGYNELVHPTNQLKVGGTMPWDTPAASR